MDAPRRALTELHPAKELLQRGREGWPVGGIETKLGKKCEYLMRLDQIREYLTIQHAQSDLYELFGGI